MLLLFSCKHECGNICENGSTCIDGKCACPPGYSGNRCEIKDECYMKCKNDATCNNGKCDCLLSFSGEKCEKSLISGRSYIHMGSAYKSDANSSVVTNYINAPVGDTLLATHNLLYADKNRIIFNFKWKNTTVFSMPYQGSSSIFVPAGGKYTYSGEIGNGDNLTFTIYYRDSPSSMYNDKVGEIYLKAIN